MIALSFIVSWVVIALAICLAILTWQVLNLSADAFAQWREDRESGVSSSDRERER